MEGDYKEVDFYKYCRTCKYWNLTESEDPCFCCMTEPIRPDTHKPAKWEEK